MSIPRRWISSAKQALALERVDKTDMMDKPAERIIVEQVRFFRLLVYYIYLHFRYLYLLVRYCFLKVAGAALIEAVKIEYFIKSLSKEDRIVFSTCIAFAIYVLALNLMFAIRLDVTAWM